MADVPRELTGGGVHRIVFDLIKDESGSLLDVGAGEGALCKLLEEGSNLKVTATEINPDQFKVPNVECIQHDVTEKFPFPNDRFNVVVMIELLEHLKNPWMPIEESSRVLKPGGLLIVTTPNIQNKYSQKCFRERGNFYGFDADKWETPMDHINPISLWELELILKTNGFAVEQISFDVFYLPGMWWWKNLNEKVFRRYLDVNIENGRTLIVKARLKA